MSRFDVVKEEEKVLRFWKDRDIFVRSVEQRKDKKPFVFFEGPPTANGRPGIHHVVGRTFKDIILRYKTMRGFWVWRRAGWDTHGLPVELEVEKELGLKNKKEIESYGIAAFNRKCRESVWKYKQEWERLTERMGFWVDLNDPYITYSPRYIENVWAVFKEFWKKKLLFRDFKVVPYCVRCGTPLSSHEVAQGYATAKDKAVYVKFKVKNPEKAGLKGNVFLLAWTTTPWTLPGNVALAVGEDIEYFVGEVETSEIPEVKKGDNLIFAHSAETSINIFQNNLNYGPLPHEGDYEWVNVNFRGKGNIIFKNIKYFRGNELVGLEYEPLFEIPELAGDKSYKVYLADFVSTEEGTGIVHTAVMYGVEDFELGSAIGLPKFHTVNEDGKFVDSVPVVGGRSIVKDRRKDPEVENLILAYLRERGLLLAGEEYSHEYPFCWRCKTPLLYYARSSWFIGTSKKRSELIENNKKINWVPAHIKEGRFGEWLREVKDWAVSRERYWGTPLPIWECENNWCNHTIAIGSLDELNKLRPDKPTTFVFVRHGEAVSNAQQFVSSLPEPSENPLTEKGRAEVKKGAKKLPKKIDATYVSPLLRAQQTVEILKEHRDIGEVSTAHELREIDLGELNGTSIADYHHFFHFLQERLFKAPAGGETGEEVQKRVWGFLKEKAREHSGQTVLIVTHRLPIAIATALMSGIGSDDFRFWDTERTPENGEIMVQEFPNWPFDDRGEVDLHRPHVDEVKIACAECGSNMYRVEDLADVWFDSGAMPFAQPAGSRKYSEQIAKPGLGEPLNGQFPADYIVEGIDQTRGWFYTLHAISTLLGRGPSYRNVICYGHVLDKTGKKMSKSLGNIVDPWDLIEKWGIDALRWYFFTVNAPGDPKLFNPDDIGERYRRFVMTALNSLVFLETYWSADIRSNTGDVHALDRWIMSRFDSTHADVTAALDSYDVTGAARALDGFVQELSNWYIRRSRPRLQDPEHTPARAAAQQTLWNVLYKTAHVVAPFAPFLAEIMFKRLTALAPSEAAESVHLADWPEPFSVLDPALEEHMRAIRDLASRGLAERARAGIKVRQPLASAEIAAEWRDSFSGIEDILADEVNVREIRYSESRTRDEIVLDQTLSPALVREGLIRGIIRAANDLRRKAGLKPADRIDLYLSVERGGSREDIGEFSETLKAETRADGVHRQREPHPALDAEHEFREADYTVWIGIKKRSHG